MYQNYNYYPQQQTPQNLQNANPQYLAYQRQVPPQLNLKGRPVSSLEEARATSIDFDGSVFYFPDLASKRIYTKHIGMDGIAVLNMYELKEMPIQQPQKEIDLSHYVTREELEQTILQFKGMLEQTLNNKKEVKKPVVNF